MTDDEKRAAYATAAMAGLITRGSHETKPLVELAWTVAEEMLMHEKRLKAKREMEGRP